MSENDISADQLAEIGNLWARHTFNLERRISLEEEGAVEKLAVIKSVPRLIDEIRRLRQVIKRKNHCVECGELNPVDNICEDCWKGMES